MVVPPEEMERKVTAACLDEMEAPEREVPLVPLEWAEQREIVVLLGRPVKTVPLALLDVLFPDELETLGPLETLVPPVPLVPREIMVLVVPLETPEKMVYPDDPETMDEVVCPEPRVTVELPETPEPPETLELLDLRETTVLVVCPEMMDDLVVLEWVVLRETLVPLELERPEPRETEETQEIMECLAEAVTEETPGKMVFPETQELAELRETVVLRDPPDVMDSLVGLEPREIQAL